MTRIEGFGLRTAAPCAVAFERRVGPVVLVQGGDVVPIRDLRVENATRATIVTGGGLRVATVEHLFAALAAAGVREGLAIHVEGPEIPLAEMRQLTGTTIEADTKRPVTDLDRSAALPAERRCADGAASRYRNGERVVKPCRGDLCQPMKPREAKAMKIYLLGSDPWIL